MFTFICELVILNSLFVKRHIDYVPSIDNMNGHIHVQAIGFAVSLLNINVFTPRNHGI